MQTAERANKSVIVTSSYFTEEDRKFAEEQKILIDLIDIDNLIKLIKRVLKKSKVTRCIKRKGKNEKILCKKTRVA